MKSFIKKVMVVVVLLAAVVDWPVETKAINGKAIEKVSSGLLKACSKGTKKVERFVNKATQETEKTVNEATENPNVQRGAAISGSRMLKNTTQSNAHECSHVHVVTEEEMCRATTDMSIAVAVAMVQEGYSSSDDKK